MFFFSSRISSKQLAAFCRRMATSLSAGVDIRRTTVREADMARGPAKHRMETIRDAVGRGESLASAIDATGEFFPSLFRQLVAVGEQSGHTAEVFKQLADHYEHQVSLRRSIRPQHHLAGNPIDRCAGRSWLADLGERLAQLTRKQDGPSRLGAGRQFGPADLPVWFGADCVRDCDLSVAPDSAEHLFGGPCKSLCSAFPSWGAPSAR